MQAFEALGYITLAILVFVLFLCAMPWLFIISANTLFDTSLTHGFWQYVSFWVIYTMADSSVVVRTK